MCHGTPYSLSLLQLLLLLLLLLIGLFVSIAEARVYSRSIANAKHLASLFLSARRRCLYTLGCIIYKCDLYCKCAGCGSLSPHQYTRTCRCRSPILAYIEPLDRKSNAVAKERERERERIMHTGHSTPRTVQYLIYPRKVFARAGGRGRKFLRVY